MLVLGGNKAFKLALDILAVGILAGCASGSWSPVAIGVGVEGFMTPRGSYDTSMNFYELVRPHFFALSEGGVPVPVEGGLGRMVLRDGKIKIHLLHDGDELYVDPLALTAGELGEHPVHRVYRLEAMGIPLDEKLREELDNPASLGRLFHILEFEYLRGKTSRGTIAEVFPDGTFLVIPHGHPEEWQSLQEEVASPTHLHVNPRALTVASSALAIEYEDRMLALSFDNQCYPSPDLALQQCQVYQEGLGGADYRDVLNAIGFAFTPVHVLGDVYQTTDVFGE